MAQIDSKSNEKAQKRFSTAEICRIIKLSKKQGVSQLKIGDLFVSFLEKDSKVSARRHAAAAVSDQKTENAAASKAFEIQDQVSLEEYKAAQLLIDDPQGFEDAAIDAAVHGTGMVTLNENQGHW